MAQEEEGSSLHLATSERFPECDVVIDVIIEQLSRKQSISGLQSNMYIKKSWNYNAELPPKISIIPT